METRTTRGSSPGRSPGTRTSSAEGSGAAEPPPPPKEYTLEELHKLKVRELKTLLHAYGVLECEAVEKEELVEVIYALQQAAVTGRGEEAPPMYQF